MRRFGPALFDEQFALTVMAILGVVLALQAPLGDWRNILTVVVLVLGGAVLYLQFRKVYARVCADDDRQSHVRDQLGGLTGSEREVVRYLARIGYATDNQVAEYLQDQNLSPANVRQVANRCALLVRNGAGYWCVQPDLKDAVAKALTESPLP